MEVIYHNADVFSLIVQSLSATSVTLEHRLFKKSRISFRCTDDAALAVQVKILDPNQVVPPTLLHYNVHEGCDMAEWSSLMVDFHPNYASILAMKPCVRKLLRLAQCSTALHRLVMSHPLWNLIAAHYDSNRFISPKFSFPRLLPGEEYKFLAAVYRTGERLNERVKAIVNYRPPAQATKKMIIKRKAAESVEERLTPKRRKESK
jgi:hypothetical protein